MRTAWAAAASIVLVALGGCLENEGDDVVLSLDQVPPLGVAVVYEGWVQIAGEWTSFGKFIVRADGTVADAEGFKRHGNVSQAVFEKVKDGRDAVAIMVTIEPGADPSPLPSNHRLLYGVVGGREDERRANLGQGGEATILPEMRFAAGSFTLITPTDDVNDPRNNTNNNQSGIWYYAQADPRCGQEALAVCQGLNLPTLPSGWKYEGWIVDDQVDPPKYYTTGKFRSPLGRDDDASTARSRGLGSLGPPFPGQDFVNATLDVPILNLTSGRFRTFISVELDPDTNPDPFFLQPLDGDLPRGTRTAPASHEMDSLATRGFPRGTARIEERGFAS
ncbi:MAG: hypothetical protein ACT4PT_07655 [Methanobacteriota archaeon]